VRKRLWQVSEELIRPYTQLAANEVGGRDYSLRQR
jgi:hypothetical protein